MTEVQTKHEIDSIENRDPELVDFLRKNPEGRFEDLDKFVAQRNKVRGAAVAVENPNDGEKH